MGQFAPRTIARTLPDPEVRLTKRVARLPAPVPRDTPVMAFTPGTPAINYLPLWRRLYDRVLREGSALLGMATLPASRRYGPPLPAILRSPAALTVTPAR